MISIKQLLLILTLAMLTMISCSSDDKVAEIPCNDFVLLGTWMAGSFSSQEQAKADSNFYDKRLEMKRIWKDLPDGYWIYVEQAVATDLETPYRQRVYYVTQIDDSTFESAVYTFEEPLRFAGVWKEEMPLASLTPDSLTEREGCSIILKKSGRDKFVGSTVDNNCESSLQGASFATSEVTIKQDVLISWDRGYDTNDNQIWGAKTGGYIFKRINLLAEHN
jgi:CpeT protein